MKIKTTCFFAIMGSVWISQACYRDVEEEFAMNEGVKFNLVQEELRPYFQRFEDEAKKLGIEVDLTAAGIGGIIKGIEEENVVGRCTTHSNGYNEITFDETYWERSSDLFKEFIIFHELGHGYLLRGHLEDTFDDGICVSIMRSGQESCRDSYHSGSREYYIEELFFPGNSTPKLAESNGRVKSLFRCDISYF